MQDVDLNQVIDKRIKRNVYSPEGVLLISLSTLLTPLHITMLKNHGITLTSADVEANETYSSTHSKYLPIEQIVVQIKQIFEEIRDTKQIPIAEVRKSIIPAIHETVHK